MLLWCCFAWNQDGECVSLKEGTCFLRDGWRWGCLPHVILLSSLVQVMLMNPSRIVLGFVRFFVLCMVSRLGRDKASLSQVCLPITFPHGSSTSIKDGHLILMHPSNIHLLLSCLHHFLHSRHVPRTTS